MFILCSVLLSFPYAVNKTTTGLVNHFLKDRNNRRETTTKISKTATDLVLDILDVNTEWHRDRISEYPDRSNVVTNPSIKRGFSSK